jgi:hypothetical protein
MRLDLLPPFEPRFGEFPQLRQPDVTTGDKLGEVPATDQEAEEGERNVPS